MVCIPGGYMLFFFWLHFSLILSLISEGSYCFGLILETRS